MSTTTTRAFNPADIICRQEFKSRITDEMLTWVNQRPNVSKTFVRCHDGEIKNEDSTFVCNHCDERHNDDISSSVYVRINSRNIEKTWCEGCRDDNAFYCNGTGDYHADEDYTRIDIEGRDYCQERYGDDLYYWESDEEYHLEPEPSEDDDGVAKYHSLDRPWEARRTIAHDAIGVELETYATDAYTHASKALSLGLLAERDGSLCSTHGVEIIGPPMLIAEYSAPESPWRKLFESSRFSAWDAGEGYGMHVNLNRSGINKLEVSRIVCFIHGNKAFCELVGGRQEQHWAKYSPKCIGSKCYDKHEAAALRKGGRIEVRIFRATKKWESFMKNIEFCDAVRAYIKERAGCGHGINLPDYLSFVTSQPERWPHFHAWLKARTTKGVA